jgi:hypothetical protein
VIADFGKPYGTLNRMAVLLAYRVLRLWLPIRNSPKRPLAQQADTVLRQLGVRGDGEDRQPREWI